LYKLLCDIELTRTRFVRVTSKSVGSGSSGSDGGSRLRREIDIIIILFFVWSVSQTSLCVYATTYVRACTTVYHCPSSSLKVPPWFHSSLVTTPRTVIIIITTIIIIIILSPWTVGVCAYALVLLWCAFSIFLFNFCVIFCLTDNITCEKINSCSPARHNPYL